MYEKLCDIVCEALACDSCIGCCNHPPCRQVEIVVDKLIEAGVRIDN